MRLADPAVSTERIEAVLLAMGLTQRGIDARTPVGVGGRPLSGGERRRLCLARAIVKNPRVLLLDEPTEGIDGPTTRFVLQRLRELLPTATIVAAIHDRDLDAVVPNFVARLSLARVGTLVGFPAASRPPAAQRGRVGSHHNPAGGPTGCEGRVVSRLRG